MMESDRVLPKAGVYQETIVLQVLLNFLSLRNDRPLYSTELFLQIGDLEFRTNPALSCTPPSPWGTKILQLDRQSLLLLDLNKRNCPWVKFS